MSQKYFVFPRITILCCCFCALISYNAYAGSNEVLTAEKVVAAHVKSIGSPILLSKVQSRTFVGISNVEFIQGMRGSMKGSSMMASQGHKIGIVLKYPDINYPGEYFAYDGKEVTVGHMSPGQRSPIADFMYRFNKVIKEGLIGGVFNASWPLLNVQNQNTEIRYRKTSIEGRELHEIEYHPKVGFGDMKIRMYFDLTTFKHLRTEYRVQHRGDMSIMNAETFDTAISKNQSGDDAPAGKDPMSVIGEARSDSYYVLVEKFDDFKKVGGMTLPHRYTLDYTVEGQGPAFIANWTVNVAKWGFNTPNLDQKIFVAQK